MIPSIPYHNFGLNERALEDAGFVCFGIDIRIDIPPFGLMTSSTTSWHLPPYLEWTVVPEASETLTLPGPAVIKTATGQVILTTRVCDTVTLKGARVARPDEIIPPKRPRRRGKKHAMRLEQLP